MGGVAFATVRAAWSGSAGLRPRGRRALEERGLGDHWRNRARAVAIPRKEKKPATSVTVVRTIDED
jgi:hypothetical protein